MNIIVQTTGRYASSLNGKSESPNKTLANITRALLLNSSHKKEFWCFAYQNAIWISRQTENRLPGDVPYFLWHGIRPSYKHIKIWGVRVYIINGSAIRNKLDDRSHRCCSMGYAATTGVILYWKLDQPFIIHRAHHFLFDEYNYRLSIEDKHTPGSLLLWQDSEGHIHNSDLLNMIPCELDLTYTSFRDEIIIKYNIELPPSGKKIGFHLLDDEDFTIPYITNTIPNSPAGHQLPSQAKRNVWIVAINGEDPITAQGVLDEFNCHQTQRGKSKINISLCRRKSYQRELLEEFTLDLIKSDLWFHILKLVSQRNLSHQRILVVF